MTYNLQEINNKLIDILSQEKGYFGKVYTWGQRSTDYEFVGYELDTDFFETLKNMSDEQVKNLVRIINYFEIHVGPLKKMLGDNKKETTLDFYSEWAWSHFMTVVMFGILEVAVKINPCVKYKDKNKKYIAKCESIKLFLETYLPQDVRNSLTERYKTENGVKLQSFAEVIKHLWNEIRSGFIHEASVYYKGLEWSTLKGVGSKEDPLTIETDVPVQELMQITWQAILNSYGYIGLLRLPKYKNSK